MTTTVSSTDACVDGMEVPLLRLVYDALFESNIFCTSELFASKDMLARFGSPTPSGYMSEGFEWRIDDDTVAAIHEAAGTYL